MVRDEEFIGTFLTPIRIHTKIGHQKLIVEKFIKWTIVPKDIFDISCTPNSENDNPDFYLANLKIISNSVLANTFL